MKSIAIHYGHNCTVGYADGGEIKTLLSEERLCRVKNATGFPALALRHVVDEHLGGDLKNVDQVAIIDGTGARAHQLNRIGFGTKHYLDYYWKNKEAHLKKMNFIHSGIHKRFLKSIRLKLRGLTGHAEIAKAEMIRKIGLEPEKVLFLDHHACHAATVAHFSPVSDGGSWLVLTLDGEGDGLSSTVSIFEDGRFTRVSANARGDSLGLIFGQTTSYLGMKSNEHEFKLMGMAPYADQEHVARVARNLSALIRLDETGQFRMSIPATDIMKSLFRIYAFERFDVISGAIQKLTEDLVCEWAGHWIKATGVANVAVSGGVFMNVKAAKKLAEHPLVERLFVAPSASDESLPIGALWLLHRPEGLPVRAIDDLYLGRNFSDEYVEAMIARESLAAEFDIEDFETPSQLATRVADLLAADEIVARCSGREEWGARALGNRSIMCNPSNFANIERLNSKIKCRDFWMPFTPSILQEALPNYILNHKNTFAPYMAITFDTTQLARSHFAAAVHPRDFTMRPQEVVAKWNPDYHAILSEFKARTGIGGVLNTSFNLHGEPNVSTPEDAIRTVRQSELDYVVIGKRLFRKRS